MKRVLFLIVLVMLVSWLLVSRRNALQAARRRAFESHQQTIRALDAGRPVISRADPRLESRKQTRRALAEAREALAEARNEVHHAFAEARDDVRAAFDEVRVALVNDDDPAHGPRPVPAPKALASEEVDGLPVPIVPGTRVTKAEATPPIHPQPVVSVHAPAPPAPPAPPTPARAPVPAVVKASGPQTVTGQLSANQERAIADARHQLRSRIVHWLDPEVPGSWSPPTRLINAMILGQPQIRQIHKDYGELFEATLTVDTSPARRNALIEVYNRQLVEQRMASLGGSLAFVLICLAAVSGYVRADEATKGYYTNRLRLLSAAGVGAAGVIIYHMVV
jgi:hypothetical protein